MKWHGKAALYSGILLVGIPAVQGALFYHILTSPNKIEKADAIVVFMGARERIRKGYDLAVSGMAPYLILSPADAAEIRSFRRKTPGKSASFRHLIEDQAETTFQNTLLTARLIEAHDLQTCLLVTDLYHMPRSWLLLKIVLAGKPVKITPSPVAPGTFPRSPLNWSTRQKKRVYNEMIEFWGSISEMIHHAATGRLPRHGLKESKTISSLRSLLLFRID